MKFIYAVSRCVQCTRGIDNVVLFRSIKTRKSRIMAVFVCPFYYLFVFIISMRFFVLFVSGVESFIYCVHFSLVYLHIIFVVSINRKLSPHLIWLCCLIINIILPRTRDPETRVKRPRVVTCAHARIKSEDLCI
jgi:hypothetical protein